MNIRIYVVKIFIITNDYYLATPACVATFVFATLCQSIFPTHPKSDNNYYMHNIIGVKTSLRVDSLSYFNTNRIVSAAIYRKC